MQYSLPFKKSILSFLLTTTGLLLPTNNHLSAFSQESSDQETKLHSTPNSPSFFQPRLDEKLRAALQFDLLDDRGEWIVDLSEDQLDSLKERIELMDELIACSVVLESQASDDRTSPDQSGVLKAASSILSEMESSEQDNSHTFLATILNPQQMETVELYQNNRRAAYLEKRKKLDARSMIFLGETLLRIAERGSVEAFRGIDRKATPPALNEKAPESLIQFEGYWFHSQPVQFSASSWKMIENTIETTETYKDFVHHFPGGGGGKFCGKFHPNLYLRFTAKDM